MTLIAQGSFFADRRPPIEIRRARFADIDHRALLAEIDPQQYEYRMYDTVGPRPRLERWFHLNKTRTYTFGGGAPIKPVAPGPTLYSIMTQCDVWADSCFANYYRSGLDYIDWHADDEDWIVDDISSVSFGGSRTMRFRLKSDHAQTWDIDLNHGDWLRMMPGTQERYEHTIPRQLHARRPRLNLTIRRTR